MARSTRRQASEELSQEGGAGKPPRGAGRVFLPASTPGMKRPLEDPEEAGRPPWRRPEAAEQTAAPPASALPAPCFGGAGRSALAELLQQTAPETPPPSAAPAPCFGGAGRGALAEPLQQTAPETPPPSALAEEDEVVEVSPVPATPKQVAPPTVKKRPAPPPGPPPKRLTAAKAGQGTGSQAPAKGAEGKGGGKPAKGAGEGSLEGKGGKQAKGGKERGEVQEKGKGSEPGKGQEKGDGKGPFGQAARAARAKSHASVLSLRRVAQTLGRLCVEADQALQQAARATWGPDDVVAADSPFGSAVP